MDDCSSSDDDSSSCASAPAKKKSRTTESNDRVLAALYNKCPDQVYSQDEGAGAHLSSLCDSTAAEQLFYQDVNGRTPLLCCCSAKEPPHNLIKQMLDRGNHVFVHGHVHMDVQGTTLPLVDVGDNANEQALRILASQRPDVETVKLLIRKSPGQLFQHREDDSETIENLASDACALIGTWESSPDKVRALAKQKKVVELFRVSISAYNKSDWACLIRLCGTSKELRAEIKRAEELKRNSGALEPKQKVAKLSAKEHQKDDKIKTLKEKVKELESDVRTWKDEYGIQDYRGKMTDEQVWRYVWPDLKKQGWVVKEGKGLASWHYHPPKGFRSSIGRSKKSKYYVSLGEVLDQLENRGRTEEEIGGRSVTEEVGGAVREELAEVREELAEARKELAKARKELAEAREKLAGAREDVAEVREELAEAQEDVAGREERFREQEAKHSEAVDALSRFNKKNVELLSAAKEALAAATNCVICMDRPRSVLYIPCMHCVACEECSDRPETASCAICRGSIVNRMNKIIMP